MRARLSVRSAFLALVLLGLAEGCVRAAVDLAQALDGTGLVWQSGGSAAWYGQIQVTHDGVDAASSGSITNDQESWVQTTVTGPGVLQFWWKISSELGYDQLQFLIDEEEQVNISGEVDWQLQSVDVASGSHVLKWRYAKDESDSSGQDRGWLDQVSYGPLGDTAPVIVTPPVSQTVATGMAVQFTVAATGIPAPGYRWYFNGTVIAGATSNTLELGAVMPGQAGRYTVVASNYLGSVTSAPAVLTVTMLGEAVEAPNWGWRVGGQSSWFAQNEITHDGLDAAESGAITNNQQSWVETTVIGRGLLTFWWKVSSEPFYDGLQFLTNGVVAASLSGEAAWEQQVFLLPAGTHQVRWRYFKDASLTMGQDRGWLDQVSFVPKNPPSSLNLAWTAPVITENDAATLNGSFVDPDGLEEHLVVIQWGDGSAPTVTNLAVGVVNFTVSRQFRDDSPTGTSSDTNVVSVTVSDDVGSIGGSLPLRINNLAPRLQNVALTSPIFPYDTVTLTGTLDDVGSLDTLRLILNWGDGSRLETNNYAAGPRTFSFRHKYVLANTNITVTLNLQDDDNGSVTVRTNLSIRPFPARARVESIRPSGSTAVVLRVQGTAQAIYQVQASEDLRRWVTIAFRAVPTNGSFEVEDPDRPAHAKRFYRAIWDTQSPGPRFAGISKLPGGFPRMKLVGVPSTAYAIDAGTSLTTWGRLRTVTTGTNGWVTFDDTSPAAPRRFYRAVLP